MMEWMRLNSYKNDGDEERTRYLLNIGNISIEHIFTIHNILRQGVNKTDGFLKNKIKANFSYKVGNLESSIDREAAVAKWKELLAVGGLKYEDGHMEWIKTASPLI